jgi:cobalt-zinc-cadmium efflux system protein
VPHDHSHAHWHHHQHGHAPEHFGLSFGIATALNLALVIGQLWYGLAANSLALLADAGHNFGDVLGLVMAWGAIAIADWRPSDRFTFRLHAASILSAFANGVILLVATGAIAWEAIRRFSEPQPVASTTVIVVAALAVIVNGVSAWLLSRGSRSDLNVRSAFLHMLADAGVSFAVIVAALGIMLTGWQWLDPAVSLLISAVILWGTWGLLRESLRLSLNAAPRAVDPDDVRQYLASLPQVAGAISSRRRDTREMRSCSGWPTNWSTASPSVTARCRSSLSRTPARFSAINGSETYEKSSSRKTIGLPCGVRSQACSQASR